MYELLRMKSIVVRIVFTWLALSFLFPGISDAGILKKRPAFPVKPSLAPTNEDRDPQEGKKTIRDRWSIKPPEYELNRPGRFWDPFRQNILKGDYPIIGQNTFLILTAVNDTLFEAKRLPVPSNVSAAGPGRFDFFGNGLLTAFQQNFKFSFELYHGNTAFKPRDWAVKVTPVLNISNLNANERGIVNASVARGTIRTQHDFALQEAFVEKHILNVNPRYDFISIRGGIQPFTTDFRGLIYSDINFGGRLFGSFGNNKAQWNLASFDQLEKSTNSELNTFARRHQQVSVANIYLQDFVGILGWTNQLSLHWNHDADTMHYDINGILVRPDPLGAATPHEIDAFYLGWTSDGHIGRINVSHALYYAFGEDDLNTLSNRRVKISSLLAATELSYDRDWMRFKGSILFAEGDDNPQDGTAKGFDSIFDNQKFAGGDNTFFNHEAIRINGVNLTQRNSFLPSLRSSKTEGQSNFVNPGILVFNMGYDAEILPELKASLNVNYLRFHQTEPLELFLNQSRVRHDIGWDYSLGLQYRPFLNNNVILNTRFALFQPLGGFQDIYKDGPLYSTSTNVILTF